MLRYRLTIAGTAFARTRYPSLLCRVERRGQSAQVLQRVQRRRAQRARRRMVRQRFARERRAHARDPRFAEIRRKTAQHDDVEHEQVGEQRARRADRCGVVVQRRLRDRDRRAPRAPRPPLPSSRRTTGRACARASAARSRRRTIRSSRVCRTRPGRRRGTARGPSSGENPREPYRARPSITIPAPKPVPHVRYASPPTPRSAPQRTSASAHAAAS